jgi:hypothetical protein
LRFFPVIRSFWFDQHSFGLWVIIFPGSLYWQMRWTFPVIVAWHGGFRLLVSKMRMVTRISCRLTSSIISLCEGCSELFAIAWCDNRGWSAPAPQRRYGRLTGVGAAVANAVYHATGRRIRDLPITLDKLL